MKKGQKQQPAAKTSGRKPAAKPGKPAAAARPAPKPAAARSGAKKPAAAAAAPAEDGPPAETFHAFSRLLSRTLYGIPGKSTLRGGVGRTWRLRSQQAQQPAPEAVPLPASPLPPPPSTAGTRWGRWWRSPAKAPSPEPAPRPPRPSTRTYASAVPLPPGADGEPRTPARAADADPPRKRKRAQWGAEEEPAVGTTTAGPAAEDSPAPERNSPAPKHKAQSKSPTPPPRKRSKSPTPPPPVCAPSSAAELSLLKRQPKDRWAGRPPAAVLEYALDRPPAAASLRFLEGREGVCRVDRLGLLWRLASDPTAASAAAGGDDPSSSDSDSGSSAGPRRKRQRREEGKDEWPRRRDGTPSGEWYHAVLAAAKLQGKRPEYPILRAPPPAPVSQGSASPAGSPAGSPGATPCKPAASQEDLPPFWQVELTSEDRADAREKRRLRWGSDTTGVRDGNGWRNGPGCLSAYVCEGPKGRKVKKGHGAGSAGIKDAPGSDDEDDAEPAAGDEDEDDDKEDDDAEDEDEDGGDAEGADVGEQ